MILELNIFIEEETNEITHVSINNGIFLCDACAEEHKALGANIS
jgi:hypothetical protein